MMRLGLFLSAAVVTASASASQESYYNPFMVQTYLPIQTLPSSTSPANWLLPPQQFPYGRPDLTCVVAAAQRRNIPVDIMLGIQSVERGETGQQVRNRNVSYDLGAFQINTIHLPRIAQMGGSKDDLLNRGCYNAEVASLLLYEALTHPKKQHEDIFTRAAGYHSWNPKHNQTYRHKLISYTRQWQTWLRANNLSNLISSRL